jgi:hypothetical protein
VNLLNSWGWEILPLSRYRPDLASLDFHLFAKVKSTTEVSDSTTVKMFKMKSKNGYVPRVHFYEGLDKLMYHCDKCLNSLGDCVKKLS